MKTTVIAVVAAWTLLQTGTSAFAQNPVVNGQFQVQSHYDPFSNQWVVESQRSMQRESYYNLDRHVVDPGSYQNVDRYFRDSSGQLVREYGRTWTSHGTPHGNLARERVTHYPGNHGWNARPNLTHVDREEVSYDIER